MAFSKLKFNGLLVLTRFTYDSFVITILRRPVCSGDDEPIAGESAKYVPSIITSSPMASKVPSLS